MYKFSLNVCIFALKMESVGAQLITLYELPVQTEIRVEIVILILSLLLYFNSRNDVLPAPQQIGSIAAAVLSSSIKSIQP